MKRYITKRYVLLVSIVTVPLLLVLIDTSRKSILRVNQPNVGTSGHNTELRKMVDDKKQPYGKSTDDDQARTLQKLKQGARRSSHDVVNRNYVAIKNTNENTSGNNYNIDILGNMTKTVLPDSKTQHILHIKDTITDGMKRSPINRANNPQFVDVNQPGFFTFHNICIENAPSGCKIHVQRGKKFLLKHLKPKRLVVYNSREDLSAQRFLVNASWLKTAGDILAWNITLSRSQIPQHYHYITSHSALFVITSCERNLYHFWEDHARDLHTTLKLTNVLQNSELQQLFYQEPLRDILPIRNMKQCSGPDRFEPLLLALPLRPWHDTYHKAPHGTCYQNAVFGAPQHGAHPGEAENYIITQLKNRGSLTDCPSSSGDIVLIQRLGTRKILNIDALYSILVDSGYKDVNVYDLEKLSVLQQLQIVHCSKVLVGVHGQALQWHVFMGPETAVIEIAWPRQHWPFFYTPRARQRGQVAQGVDAIPVELHWEAWHEWFFDIHGYKASEEDVQAAFTGNNSYADWGSIWRFANVNIPTGPFMKAFFNVTAQIGLYPDNH